MTLKTANTGGALPMPVRGVIGAYTGTLGRPARGNEPGVLAGEPAGVALSMLIKDSWTNPATASTTAYISTALTGATYQPNNSTVVTARGASWDGTLGSTGKPPHPRNVVVTTTHSSAVVACTVTVTGKDLYGRTITEAFTVSAGGTSQTNTGTTAFWQVDSITIASASNCTANSTQLGTGAVLGLSMPNAVASAVKEIAAGSVVTNGVFTAMSTSANADKRGTYAPNSAPDGSRDYTVWYICDDPSAL